MSFIRWVFLLALVMLGAGLFVGVRILGPMFSDRAFGDSGQIVAIHTTTHRATATSRPRATSTSRPAPPTAPPTASPTATVAPTAIPTAPPTAAPLPTHTPLPPPTARPTTHATKRAVAPPHHVRPPRPTATPFPSATPLPTSTPLTGVVTLVSYWIGSPSARPGTIISVGYVINNGTGRTQQVMLGASVKSARTVGWISSIADPAHDVVATVPPGTSTHVRYFTLPSSLRTGAYDVAWGLRNAVNGDRDALVFAPSALSVVR